MNLNDLKQLTQPVKEPTWLDLFRLVRTLSPAERSTFIRMSIFPWPTRKGNAIMYAGVIFQLFAAIWLGIVVVRGLVLLDTPLGYACSVWVVMLAADSFIRSTARSLSRGVTARKNAITNAMMETINKMVDAHGREIIDRLKEASGRDTIAMDPISMTAATLSVNEKSRSHKRDKSNPLKSALADDLHPFDLIDDDPKNDESAY